MKRVSLQIQYIHDDSESTEDEMILELTLTTGSSLKLPSYLQGSLRFPLHVNITPVNDPPVLEIPTTKVLRLAQVSPGQQPQEKQPTLRAPSHTRAYRPLELCLFAIKELTTTSTYVLACIYTILLRPTVKSIHGISCIYKSGCQAFVYGRFAF